VIDWTDPKLGWGGDAVCFFGAEVPLFVQAGDPYSAVQTELI
jgi:hypothetical protein